MNPLFKIPIKCHYNINFLAVNPEESGINEESNQKGLTNFKPRVKILGLMGFSGIFPCNNIHFTRLFCEICFPKWYQSRTIYKSSLDYLFFSLSLEK